MTTTVFRGSKKDLIKRIRSVVSALGGSGPDVHGVARGFSIAVGMAALGDIHGAYVTKARGGTDAMGVKWPPLKPETVARRRIGQSAKWSVPIRERQKIVEREYKKALKRLEVQRRKRAAMLTLSMPRQQAETAAKIYAEKEASRISGKTKLDTLGFRQVEILRDTGVLMNSLQVGTFTGSGYLPPQVDGGENQVFVVKPGEVTIGTNDIKFTTHQFGDPTRNIPQRKILPESADEIPDAWWNNWINAGNTYLRAMLTRVVR